MIRAYKFRLYPNADQERELLIALETHRRLWNECLDWRSLAYEVYGATITEFEMSRWFTQEKRKNPYYARLNDSCARRTIKRLYQAYQSFFRHAKTGGKRGFPRFKSKDGIISFTGQPRSGGMHFIGNRLRVQHIGAIRVVVHREIAGTPKTYTIKREGDHWYVIIICDLGEVPVPPSKNPTVGIDVGIESFLTTSNGEQVANPKFLKQSLPRLRRGQRAVSRRKKGGKNRAKSRKQVAAIHRKVRNQRKEHHHQTALNLVRRYGFVAVERLNVRNMIKNDRLARAISDAGWSGFLGTLKQKAESAGVQIVEVDPRGTSQECSNCGATVKKALSVRWHECECGYSAHRDENAARNILARGLHACKEPAGRNVAGCRKRAPRKLFCLSSENATRSAEETF